MLPFSVELRTGQPVYEQVILAVHRAIISSQLRPGDRFPSVRKLSQALKINPNTAHKVVAQLISEGVLEVRPGIGTTVAHSPPRNPRLCRALLDDQLERFVIEARRLQLEFDDVAGALRLHWDRLGDTADSNQHPRDDTGGEYDPGRTDGDGRYREPSQ